MMKQRTGKKKRDRISLLKKGERERERERKSSLKKEKRITLIISYNFLYVIPYFYKLFEIINPRPSNSVGI